MMCVHKKNLAFRKKKEIKFLPFFGDSAQTARWFGLIHVFDNL